jgi:hypothetical protein
VWYSRCPRRVAGGDSPSSTHTLSSHPLHLQGYNPGVLLPLILIPPCGVRGVRVGLPAVITCLDACTVSSHISFLRDSLASQVLSLSCGVRGVRVGLPAVITCLKACTVSTHYHLPGIAFFPLALIPPCGVRGVRVGLPAVITCLEACAVSTHYHLPGIASLPRSYLSRPYGVTGLPTTSSFLSRVLS